MDWETYNMARQSRVQRLQETRPNPISLLDPQTPSLQAGQEVKEPRVQGLFQAPENVEAQRAYGQIGQFASNLGRTGEALQKQRINARRLTTIDKRTGTFLLNAETLKAQLKSKLVSGELLPEKYEEVHIKGLEQLKKDASEGLLNEDGQPIDHITSAGIQSKVNQYMVKELPTILGRAVNLEIDKSKYQWEDLNLRQPFLQFQDGKFDLMALDTALTSARDKGKAYVSTGVFESMDEVEKKIATWGKKMLTAELEEAQNVEELEALIETEAFANLDKSEMRKKLDNLKKELPAKIKRLEDQRSLIDDQLKRDKGELNSQIASAAISGLDTRGAIDKTIDNSIFTAEEASRLRSNLNKLPTGPWNIAPAEVRKQYFANIKNNFPLQVEIMSITTSEKPSEEQYKKLESLMKGQYEFATNLVRMMIENERRSASMGKPVSMAETQKAIADAINRHNIKNRMANPERWADWKIMKKKLVDGDWKGVYKELTDLGKLVDLFTGATDKENATIAKDNLSHLLDNQNDEQQAQATAAQITLLRKIENQARKNNTPLPDSGSDLSLLIQNIVNLNQRRDGINNELMVLTGVKPSEKEEKVDREIEKMETVGEPGPTPVTEDKGDTFKEAKARSDSLQDKPVDIENEGIEDEASEEDIKKGEEAIDKYYEDREIKRKKAKPEQDEFDKKLREEEKDQSLIDATRKEVESIEQLNNKARSLGLDKDTNFDFDYWKITATRKDIEEEIEKLRKKPKKKKYVSMLKAILDSYFFKVNE